MFLDGSRRLLPENVRLLHFMCGGKANWRFPFFLLSKERHIICMQRENVAETDFAKHKDTLLLILWRNSKYEGSLN